jgi:hypothetical protein
MMPAYFPEMGFNTSLDPEQFLLPEEPLQSNPKNPEKIEAKPKPIVKEASVLGKRE